MSDIGKVQAVRYHDISTGHRVFNHESKCRHLHGHNYRVHFYCQADQLDDLGRVIDFSEIKSKLCMWLEDQWDHRFLIWEQDDLAQSLKQLDDQVVITHFNPTAENMALYLKNEICPKQLQGTGIEVTKIIIEETRKCSVVCE